MWFLARLFESPIGSELIKGMSARSRSHAGFTRSWYSPVAALRPHVPRRVGLDCTTLDGIRSSDKRRWGDTSRCEPRHDGAQSKRQTLSPHGYRGARELKANRNDR